MADLAADRMCDLAPGRALKVAAHDGGALTRADLLNAG
jgi:hypothetical protein